MQRIIIKVTIESVRLYIAVRSPLSTQAVSVLGTAGSTSTGTCIKKIWATKNLINALFIIFTITPSYWHCTYYKCFALYFGWETDRNNILNL